MSGVTFSWNSSASAVATVDASGLVTATGNGHASVSASVGSVVGNADVQVAQDVATVQVSPSSATLPAPGSTQQYTATARDANNNLISGAQFIWFSSNHNVAIISPTGLATGTGGGDAVIIAAARGVPGMANVTVHGTPKQTYALTVSRTGGGTVVSSPDGVYCGVNCTHDFAAGLTAELSAVPDAGSAFAAWGGACSGTGSCSVTLDVARSVTATFTTPLSVVKSGTGLGTVSSAPAGIDCGADCNESYINGSAVTLTAAPLANSILTGWTGCDVASGTTCTVSMNAARAVTALFALQTYVVAISRTGSGTGTVSSTPSGISCGVTCAAPFEAGSVVALTATAGPGATFAGWSGACVGTSGCVLTMDGGKSVGATFTGIEYALTVTSSGAGTVTSDPGGIYCGADCAELFGAGSVVTLTPTPDVGSTFQGWSGACTGTGACAVTMDAARSVSAQFQTSSTGTNSLAVTVNGAGTVTSAPLGIYCGVACASSFASGTAVTLTAAPGPQAGFIGWSGACSGTGSCTITMDGSRAVTATFATYTLGVTTSGSGRVASIPAGIDCGTDCTESLGAGTQITLTPAPDAGFVFIGWSGACTGSGSCTVTMSGNQTVAASFGTVVTVRLDGNGSVSSNPAGINCGPTCSSAFPLGSSVTLSQSPGVGSVFGGWQGDCIGTTNCVLTLTGSRSVIATFRVGSTTLTLTKTGTGSGTVSSSPAGIDCGTDCTETYPAQTAVTLTATPAPGSALAAIGSPCTGSPCVFPMNANRSITVNFGVAVSLTATKSGSGTGTISGSGINCGTDCNETIGQGAFVSLQAVATSGSQFSRWTSGPCAGSISFSCSFTAGTTSPIAVDAEFNTIPLRPVTVTLAGAGSGSVSSVPAGISCGTDCAEDVVNGTAMALTATPAAGSLFDRWTSTGFCNNGTLPTCAFTMTATSLAITAFFQPTATLTVSSTHGRVVATGIDCGTDCAEVYPQGRVVTLSATPDSGYVFSGWSGACGGSGSCVVTMSGDRNVVATFAATVPLQVSVKGGGFVFVSSPVGTTCFGDCVFSYLPGTAVTITAASQDSDVTFDNWSGACVGSGSCTVTMDGPRGVTATFNWLLTLQILGNATGTVTINGATCDFAAHSPPCEVRAGARFDLTASASGTGAIVEQWSGCDDVTFSPDRRSSHCIGTMLAARTVTVTFSHPQRLTVNKPGAGLGTVVSYPAGISCGPSCTSDVADYPDGTLVTLNATANSGSTFTGWAGKGAACSGTGPCTVLMDASFSISANFGVPVPLGVTKSGVGTGRVASTPLGIDCGTTCTAAFISGTSVTFTQAPDSGSLFSGWSGPCTGTAACTFTVPNFATTVTASFGTGSTLNVSLAGTGNGGVTSSPVGINCNNVSTHDCTETYTPGTVVSLTAGAFTIYSFTGWSGACSGTTNPCSVTLDVSKSVTATFMAPQILTVTKAGAGQGTVTSNPLGVSCGVDCTQDFAYGTSVVLTAAPSAGFTFGGWSGGVCSGTALTCTVNMTAARSVTATFN